MRITALLIGLDVGSTTVKAVVVDSSNDVIIWQDYQRHETRQPEKVLEFLRRIMDDTGFPPDRFRIFITGAGSAPIAPLIGAKFVHEVYAVSLAVERFHPDVESVIELGGQDAKIILYKDDPDGGRKKKVPSMNDKCAGGTGSVIDKINSKLQIPPHVLCELDYIGSKIHPIAGKCGVFAETDINSLQKQGVSPEELMCSLFEATVQQNLSLLTRGHTLRPKVLLLGGPNTFIKGMVQCWKHNIPKIWKERGYRLPENIDPADFIFVPKNSQYFAAIGAVEYGKDEANAESFKGLDELERFISHGREKQKAANGAGRLYKSKEELETFLSNYATHPFHPMQLDKGTTFRAFLGIDGGSTSTKGVLLDSDLNVGFKAYQLSKGNPINDTMEIIRKLKEQVLEQGCDLEILGVGVTGYAKDILKDTFGADIAIVETVAHTRAALHYYDNVDVICDVGGQDIKIIFLKEGRVVDFKLNTQCSAGNGYFLQNTSESFGYPVEKYAEIAFNANVCPEFGYGCAIFLQADIVDFQRQGWKSEEILAGLANVLPKNIWMYICQIPNLPKLGHRFLLQGGTQHNLAAVKAQVDYIESRFKGKDVSPKIIVHRHTGEAGAIGCAIDAARLYSEGRRTKFIGLDAVERIRYRATRNENTQCFFCKNKCLRTFIDVETADPQDIKTESFEYKSGPEPVRSARFETQEEQERVPVPKIPLAEGVNRLIIAACEKGTVEDVNDMRIIAKRLNEIKKQHPNLVDYANKELWKSRNSSQVPTKMNGFFIPIGRRKHSEAKLMRSEIRIGIPRVLNMYSMAPFFIAYFENLGIRYENIIFSDFTNDELFKEGAKRGSIDPCFPSKLGLAHVHNLLYKKHLQSPLNFLFFPIIDELPSDLHGILASKACPTATGTVESVQAAFIKEGDFFARLGIQYIDPFLSFNDTTLVSRQLFRTFESILALKEEENLYAVQEGFVALDSFYKDLRNRGKEVLRLLEERNMIGIVMLARPYHNDPGINHGILEEFQKLGFPILSQDSLPTDRETLDRVFEEDLRTGRIPHPMDISDVWKNSYSENASRKIWAAKFIARHQNLVALELSSFKCGHDAPIYSLIQEIIECSGTPYFSFKDIDENKPSGSIKLRVETIVYFLTRYKEEMLTQLKKKEILAERLSRYKNELLTKFEGSVHAKHFSPGNGSHLKEKRILWNKDVP